MRTLFRSNGVFPLSSYVSSVLFFACVFFFFVCVFLCVFFKALLAKTSKRCFD